MQQCILSYKNRSEILELPVPLQEFELGNPHNTYSFSTINSGDVIAIGNKKLRTLSINSVFPDKAYPYLLKKDFPSPKECINIIEKWRLSGEPIRVTIVDTEVNHAFAIDEFKWGKASGDGSGDIAFTLDLTEYSYLNTEKSKGKKEIKSSDKNKLKERPKESKDVSKHKVKLGDTLWDLSEKYLGDGNRWKEIAKANNIKDGWALVVGKDIKIPAKTGGGK